MDFTLRSCSLVAWLFVFSVAAMIGNGVAGVIYSVQYRNFTYSYGVIPSLGDWLFMTANIQVIYGIFGLMSIIAGLAPNMWCSRLQYQSLDRNIVHNVSSYTFLATMATVNIMLGSIGAANLWNFCDNCQSIVYELWLVSIINISSCAIMALIFMGITVAMTLRRPSPPDFNSLIIQ